LRIVPAFSSMGGRPMRFGSRVMTGRISSRLPLIKLQIPMDSCSLVIDLCSRVSYIAYITTTQPARQETSGTRVRTGKRVSHHATSCKPRLLGEGIKPCPQTEVSHA
jgi:hypothetical protein